MEWQFTLNGTEIEEPISFSDIAFNVMRDERWHGVFIEASTTVLGFYGEAYTILKTAKDSYGFDAEVIFIASSRCEGQAEYEEVINGKLDFGDAVELCGRECLMRMRVEQDSCAMVFKNRFDQKVNFDSNIAFDKTTILADYTGLGFDMELATQEIPISADAQVSEDSDIVELLEPFEFLAGFERALYIRPIYTRVADNSIITGNLDEGTFFKAPENTFR